MSDLASAMARLERATSRLEAAVRAPRNKDNRQLAAAATEIVGRVDEALKKLDRLLGTEAA